LAAKPTAFFREMDFIALLEENRNNRDTLWIDNTLQIEVPAVALQETDSLSEPPFV
jgi:hypothetical protein